MKTTNTQQQVNHPPFYWDMQTRTRGNWQPWMIWSWTHLPVDSAGATQLRWDYYPKTEEEKA